MNIPDQLVKEHENSLFESMTFTCEIQEAAPKQAAITIAYIGKSWEECCEEIYIGSDRWLQKFEDPTKWFKPNKESILDEQYITTTELVNKYFESLNK